MLEMFFTLKKHSNSVKLVTQKNPLGVVHQIQWPSLFLYFSDVSEEYSDSFLDKEVGKGHISHSSYSQE